MSTEATPSAETAKQTKPKPATIKELKQAFPDSTSEFREKCLEADLTLEQAKDEWIKELGAQNKQLAEQKAELEEKAAKSPGTEPVGSRGVPSESDGEVDAVTQYDELVRQKMRDADMSRIDAAHAVAKGNPELHKAYLLATNGTKRAQRMIQEKFDV